MVTFAAAAGKKDLKQDLLDGYQAIGRTYKNHLDGYDMNEYLSNADKYKTVDESITASPRKEFWYFNDDGQCVAIRLSDWKAVFLENRGMAFEVWREPFTELRVPLLFNLRRDPFEKSQHNSNSYNEWFLDRPYIIVPMQQIAAKFAQTFVEFPPSQKPGSFNLDGIVEKLKQSAAGAE
jgi:arylsulfatase A-like enzyme